MRTKNTKTACSLARCAHDDGGAACIEIAAALPAADEMPGMDEFEALSPTEVRAATAAADVTAVEPRSHGFNPPGVLRGG